MMTTCFGKYLSGNIQAERDCDSCLKIEDCLEKTKHYHKMKNEQDKLGEAIDTFESIDDHVTRLKLNNDGVISFRQVLEAAKAYHQIKPLLKLMGKNRSNYANLLKLETKISEIMKGGE
ncbi:hypothetical protein KAR91_83855 [Candidatus Pacearchaeota archaeon]|nr:hypothetical protein [Candidatus Pacearchaeota archaeon]